VETDGVQWEVDYYEMCCLKCRDRITAAEKDLEYFTLWTNSYYCESVGHISEDTIKKYIEDQKTK